MSSSYPKECLTTKVLVSRAALAIDAGYEDNGDDNGDDDGDDDSMMMTMVMVIVDDDDNGYDGDGGDDDDYGINDFWFLLNK